MIYEVNLEVEPAIADEMASWLGGHIQEAISHPGFLSARLSRQEPGEEPAASTGRVRWTIQYEMKDYDSYARYIREDAARLRSKVQQRFGTRFTASRRVLMLEQTFTAGTSL